MKQYLSLNIVKEQKLKLVVVVFCYFFYNSISKNDLWRAALCCRWSYSPATLLKVAEEEEHVTKNFQKLVIVHRSSFRCFIRVTTDLRLASRKRLHFSRTYPWIFSYFVLSISTSFPNSWSLERALKASFSTNTAHIDVIRTKVSSYSRRGKKFKSIISYCQHVRSITLLIFLYRCPFVVRLNPNFTLSGWKQVESSAD